MDRPTTLLEQVLETLRAHQATARAKGIELVGVVGSVARGDARADSDVDVVYDVIGRPTYFDIGGIAVLLEDSLGRSVDMVNRRAMKPDRWAYMVRDLVAA